MGRTKVRYWNIILESSLHFWVFWTFERINSYPIFILTVWEPWMQVWFRRKDNLCARRHGTQSFVRLDKRTGNEQKRGLRQEFRMCGRNRGGRFNEAVVSASVVCQWRVFTNKSPRYCQGLKTFVEVRRWVATCPNFFLKARMHSDVRNGLPALSARGWHIYDVAAAINRDLPQNEMYLTNSITNDVLRWLRIV